MRNILLGPSSLATVEPQACNFIFIALSAFIRVFRKEEQSDPHLVLELSKLNDLHFIVVDVCVVFLLGGRHQKYQILCRRRILVDRVVRWTKLSTHTEGF